MIILQYPDNKSEFLFPQKNDPEPILHKGEKVATKDAEYVIGDIIHHIGTELDDQGVEYKVVTIKEVVLANVP